MSEQEIQKIVDVFKPYNEVKLVYLFGSRVNGKLGPLSDYDFAVYLDSQDKQKIQELKLELIAKISDALKTDNIDLVILNETESPELKYNIIKNGQLILEKEPFKVLLEPKILNEFFDFREILRRNNLTKT